MGKFAAISNERIGETVIELHAENSDNTQENESKVHRCLTFINIVLTIAGCHGYQDHGNKAAEKNWKYKFIQGYRFLIFVTCGLFVAKCIAAFTVINESDYYIQGLLLVWSFQSFGNFLLALKMTGNQNEVFEYFNTGLIPETKALGISFDEKKIVRKLMVTLAIAVVIIACVCISSAIDLAGVLFNSHTYFTAPFEANGLTKTCTYMMYLVLTLLQVIPQFYLIFVSILLNACFTSLNVHLCMQQHKDKSGMIMSSLEPLRQLHTKMCKVVSDLDKDFGYFYANTFIWNMALTFGSLFDLLKHDHETIYIVRSTYWIFQSMAILTTVSIFAAFVNESAHAPLDGIYHINVSGITTEKLAELSLFLSKLTGTQVGFTTCGLLTITKEFILTIAGVFLTYFAVLYTL